MRESRAAPVENKAVIITGTTGSGKSNLALRLCNDAALPPLEIISADSRQIYRGMDIGTDKVTPKTRKIVPHHLIDIIEPFEHFSAADYARMAHETMVSLWKRHVLPLIVGGTGLYIRVLMRGLAEVPGSNPLIRKKLKRQMENEGLDSLYRRLEHQDAKRAAEINRNDAFRIIRALEINEMGGTSISDEYRRHGFKSQTCRYLLFVLNVQREILYKRIDQRVDRMVKRGLWNEVMKLVKIHGQDTIAFTGIGYRQAIAYLDGRISENEAIRRVKRDSRRLAKRQITWFRKEPNARWVDHDPEKPLETVAKISGYIQEFLW